MTTLVKVHTVTSFSPANMLQIAQLVQTQDWTFFLDSCEQNEMGGRFDILASSPCIKYQCKHGVHSLSGKWLEEPENIHDASFLHIIKHAINTHDCPYEKLSIIHNAFSALFDDSDVAALEVPFIIGGIGAFAYDGNISSDNIHDAQAKQYKIPDISVGFYTNSLVYDNLSQSLYIFSIDDDFIKQQVDNITEIQNEQSQYRSPSHFSPNKFALTTQWQSNLPQQDYASQFAKIKQYLIEGDCYQVNFAQRFVSTYMGCEWEAYKKLRAVNKAPFSAFVRLPESTVLSLSPERFLLVQDEQVESKPIKGTRQRKSDPIEDAASANALLNAEKDKAENLMIVDLLRNDLSKHCRPNSVEVPALFALESYPAVHHMVSTVQGKLKQQSSIYSLLKGAFPGGSITGAPKVRAMQIIQELEPDKRAIYCGSIGYFGIRNDMDTNICIRTLLAENNQLYCWAGGGIVIDSNVDEEYQESKDKVAKIIPILSNSIE